MHACKHTYTSVCVCVLRADFHLSLLQRSEAVPADDGRRPAFLGLPRGRHPVSQALRGGGVDQLQPGLDGRPPACEEAVRTQVQRECLVRTDASETIPHVTPGHGPIWLNGRVLFLKRHAHSMGLWAQAAAPGTAPGAHLDPTGSNTVQAADPPPFLTERCDWSEHRDRRP